MSRKRYDEDDIKRLMFSRDTLASMEEQSNKVIELTMAGKCPEEIMQELCHDNVQWKGSQTYSRKSWQQLQRFVALPPSRRPLFNGGGVREISRLIMQSKKIVVVVGAGISVSCGVPDFRGTNGVYRKLRKIYPNLSRPEDALSIDYFDLNPSVFYNFARAIYPANVQPSVTHLFLALLEKRRKLLRLYTQNVDMLERKAGITKLIYCHGSFATATCRRCGVQVPGRRIERNILAQKIAYCRHCRVAGKVSVMKPDIIFFGEPLPGDFFDCIRGDLEEADLLLVMGTSLKVNPVCYIPDSTPRHVPRVLINLEKVGQTFDIEIFGSCDDVVKELANQMGENFQ
uniref:Deacetylase sirtuin-type domain-containing protein n=1 Tax=Trichuris muris TaxID=70415 RepID=A0A5S6QKD8_TRIMR